MTRWSLLLATSLALTEAAFGQSSGMCGWRAHPAPRCRSYLEFELTTANRQRGSDNRAPDFPASGPLEQDLPGYFVGGIGYFINPDSRHAYGAMLLGGGTDIGTRFAIEVRRRQWLPHQLTLDVGGGWLAAQMASTQTQGTQNGFGGTIETALGYGDLAGLMISADWERGAGRTAKAVHAGVRVGSAMALAGGALIGAIAAAAFGGT